MPHGIHRFDIPRYVPSVYIMVYTDGIYHGMYHGIYHGIYQISMVYTMVFHYAKPTPKGDQAVFAHTIKAPAPSLSLGGGV